LTGIFIHVTELKSYNPLYIDYRISDTVKNEQEHFSWKCIRWTNCVVWCFFFRPCII